MSGRNECPGGDRIAITVAVATCRRADALARCLEGIARQRRPADEVLVVHQSEDLETRELLAGARFCLLPIRPVTVTAAGLVAARNASLGLARADVVAFVDDDAVPRDDWTARIAAAFASDPQLAGLGGRDVIVTERFREREVVGRVQWFGRTVGNHHVGVGPRREVDFLKGCNMSFRIKKLGALRFDRRLRSNGAQVCEDMAFCLALRRAGGRLRYDPAVAVDHYPAPAADDHRITSARNVTDAVHNETLTVFEHLSAPRRAVFLLWALVIGTRGGPGVAQLPRLISRQRNWPALFLASFRGRILGFRTAMRTASRATAMGDRQADRSG
jgi:cellulose synthase/poly-beta-1,6-N-acetylglucosamine synthase-like glycosyltransferase